MQRTETYIPESALYAKFRITLAFQPQWGKFYATRYLYAITAEGGKTWQRCLFYLVFTFALTPVTLSLDVAGLTLYAVIAVLKKFVEGIVAAVLTVCQRFLGTAAIIIAAVGTVLLIYYKWDLITYYIHQILFTKFF